MQTTIVKRDGTFAPFDAAKIANAVRKAFAATHEISDTKIPLVANDIAGRVAAVVTALDFFPSVENVQDEVEEALMSLGYPKTAKAYIMYRAERSRVRESQSVLMNTLKEIVAKDASESDSKRDNANVDGNAPMGTMLQIGAAASKELYEGAFLTEEQAKAYREGDIHIHDFDFYPLTTTCTQIDIQKLFNNGFSTGHGFLREPNSIMSYASLACIVIQANQNDQHGGQSIPSFDYAMADGVRKTYRKELIQNILDIAEDYQDIEFSKDAVKDAISDAEKASKETLSFENSAVFNAALANELRINFNGAVSIYGAEDIILAARKRSLRNTEKLTHQAMEALVHNLNSMHSRAGAQVPFSSINYGLDTSPEGRMVTKNILLATEEGLGNGETPIFPIQIFSVKEGINFNPGEPNYDLFKYSMLVSAKRLFPNYAFVDAPFNLKYFKPGQPETTVAYMGCRTRVLANRNGPEIAYSRGNLSFTTINLPRLALESKSNIESFYAGLKRILKLVAQQLLDRYKIQSRRKVKNFPFMMGQGTWLDSDKLGPNDEVGESLKHGTLSIGFIGLAETLKFLYGHHHGEDAEVQKKGFEIIKFMRDFCDSEGERTSMNFTLLATPAEGLSGRFTRLDKERFGIIPGVTDREYYTNSFHVPVYYPISAYEKIKIEAPYHELTNAGHITYIEMDGDPSENLTAFEKIIRFMKESGIGYGSINHPVDRDPVCGYVGVIYDECPRCGRHANEGITAELLAELRKKYNNVPYFHGTI
ncbi:MAG: anaerobic ribonucleoside triphosphate reductase [Clostridiales bacterium]|nr:anaerobic ribonucleoside triphosphate reductase [Clostridiales bacterium]